MKKIISIIRLAIVFVLSTVCIILITGEADENGSLRQFFTVFLLTKGLGFLAGYIVYRCFLAWQHTDYYISRLVKWCDEEEC